MKELRHPIPDRATCGKTIRQLIAGLQSFEDQDMEVRLSLDYGETHHAISILEKHENKYCVLVNSENYHRNGWQEFMERGRSVE
jgi:hypothetical protein